MKKQISLLIISLLMMLNITSIYALDENKFCLYQINEDSIKDNKVILDKGMIDDYLTQQDTSYTYQEIKFVNQLPYDILLENTHFCIPSLAEFSFKDLLDNANDSSNGKVYTYQDVFSYYQDSLVFEKTPVHGYIFLDSQMDGMFDKDRERIGGISIDLWQGSNLVETCVSDSQGYYHFQNYDETLPYTLTIENMEDYIFTKYNEKPLGSHFQMEPNQKMSLEIKENTHQNIGLQKKTYTVQYINGDKIIQKQFHYQDKVTIFEDYQVKENYLFVEWNTKKDGSGKGYINNTIIYMPKNNVTLYPIYKQVTVNQPEVKKTAVFTGDQTEIMFFSLLLLASMSAMIVCKVLKKNKNR